MKPGYRLGLLTLLISALMIFALTACGDTASSGDSARGDNPEPAPAVNMTEDEINAWADEVYKDALQKLVDDGIATAYPEEGSFKFIFQPFYKTYFPETPSDEAVQQLFRDYIRLAGSSILAFRDLRNRLDVYTRTANADPVLPYFTPVRSDGTLIYDTLPSEAWATGIEECSCLIVYGRYEVKREEKFYYGGVDRVTTETLVIYIDAANREVVHIACVGDETPPSTSDHNVGLVCQEEADASIIEEVTGILEN